MTALEHEIHIRYLDRLEESTWQDEEPRLDFGASALPYFVEAFEKENAPNRRARLVRIIWQFRDLAALPILAIALNDQSNDVWKDALDGIVTLGGKQALIILKDAHAAASGSSDTEKLEWIDEAVNQMSKGI
jgi:HEAT repeat protein